MALSSSTSSHTSPSELELLALVDVEVDSPVEESLSGLLVQILVLHIYLGLILSWHPKEESNSSKNSKESCPLAVALLLSLIFLYLSTRLFHFSFSYVKVFSLSIALSWQLSLNSCEIVCHIAFFSLRAFSLSECLSMLLVGQN